MYTVSRIAQSKPGKETHDQKQRNKKDQMTPNHVSFIDNLSNVSQIYWSIAIKTEHCMYFTYKTKKM